MSVILIIEDDPAILENAIETLKLGGYDVLSAENGLDGVEMARTHLPDLIVSDIAMPRLDGFGTLLALRNDPNTLQIPFIFLTARVDRAAMRSGMELGADDYLTKPFTPNELLAAVASRLDRQKTLAADYRKQLTDLRGNILYVLPHELRTPLSTILGYSELILNENAGMSKEDLVDNVKMIHQGGIRLHRMIENFLIYAQIEIYRVDLERLAKLRALNTRKPKPLIESWVEDEANTVNRAMDLVLDLEECEKIAITPENLQKIVRELTSNALKFSKPGTPISVGGSIVDDSYVITIHDQGRGMTEEQVASIGPYMQFERKLQEQQGSGLGLTIAQGLSTLHGGLLEIESAPGEGTLVTVTLPLAAL